MIRNNSGFNIFLTMLVICSLGLGSIFVKLSPIGPINTGFYRVLVSIVFLFPFIYQNKQKISLKNILVIMFAGIFLACDFLLWNVSLHLTTVANANLLGNLVSFTIIPISYFLYKEKIPKKFLFGLFITLFGLVVLLEGKGVAEGTDSTKGNSFAFCASIFYGLFLAVVYKLREKVSAFEIMFYSGFGSLIVLIPATFLIEGIKYPHSWSSWWPLLGLAIFSQILGQGGLSYCLGKITSQLASVLILTQPVIAAIYALFIFNERLTWIELTGIVIVLVGIYISKDRSKA
ncbi:DMT family transporter [Helicobacter sp. 11S03491-1]|uniref:DMT family transporter n=1 Tax=Helicobacter sp. 11S03491-1 TaxID=1476196 RepID=UPI000BA5C72E|nr:DMT family transporter [Helicobacter sp. 11S03491-1]PAF43344.1 transporter [Helicobacter sp. 11S03491-1]